MVRKMNTLGLLLLFALCESILPFSIPPKLEQFSLQVQCTGIGGIRGFTARAVKTYFSVAGEEPLEFTQACTESEPDEKECLFERFVLSMAREVCQKDETTILERLNVNRTFIDEPFSRHLINSTSSVPVEKENQQESLINSLKLGIALGTIFGFLFGVIASCGIFGIFRKFQRNIQERNPPNTAPKATILGDKDIKTGQQNDHSSNYMYCDIEDAKYYIPKEMTCTGSSESGASYSHDCPPFTYNHLNEKNEGEVSAKYDHFREVSSGARMTNGDYKILEPLHSQDQMNLNKIPGKSPTNKEGAMNDQDTSTDAYFVLEKEIN